MHTDFSQILQKLDLLRPVEYAKNRNFIDGDVSKLSPYISRGVISTKQVFEYVMAQGYPFYKIEKFVQELVEFEKLALQIADETEHTYDVLMKILQKGHNLREAIFIAMIIGRKEGYLQAEADMEEEIKEKLYQAIRGNRNQ